jgi:6-methylsalicylic acid synthase
MAFIVSHIQNLEHKGATIHTISLDISSPTAHADLLSALDQLSLPPVSGVVHAAGVSEDNLILKATSDSLSRVFSPKIAGTLNLHRAFPPGTLDFFILFSSIGQLVGTSGQAPYGAANAFLDAIAAHRRAQGDNCVAFQWTAWRGLGLARDAEYLQAELEGKGITDVTPDEAWQAWKYVGKLDTDHAVVSRLRVLEHDEPVPIPLLEEIAPRKAAPQSAAGAESTAACGTSASTQQRPAALPTHPEALRKHLSTQIRTAIATVLHIPDIEDIDEKTPVADMGVDSVMTVQLTRELQKRVGDGIGDGVRVPPTLTWRVRDVAGLAAWFVEKAVG